MVSHDDQTIAPISPAHAINEGAPLLKKGGESEQGASFSLSVFNLIKAIMGSGILALPFAMRHMGIAVFGGFLCLTAFLAFYTIGLLLQMCTKTGKTDYVDIGEHAYGRLGRYLAACSIICQNIGSMTSYLVITGQILPSLIGLEKRLTIILCALVIDLPLALSPRIGFLGYTSFISFCVLVFFATITILGNSFLFDHSASDVEYAVFNTKTLFVAPTLVFSFVCHTVILPSYNELRNRSEGRGKAFAFTSIFISWVTYFVSALFSYLTFFGDTKTDILENYPHSMVLVKVLKIVYSLSLVLTVPLLCFPGRKAVRNGFFGGKELGTKKHVLVTLFFVSMVTLLACALDLSVVFSVSGATSSVFLVIFLPSLFYLKVGDGASVFSRSKIGPFILVLLSPVFAVTCVSIVILQALGYA
eukprot:GCRY01000725.1.p1 GENE.GCRY01000725.1~~GCRY01000725.1.p1  ORF type:complete len:417 (-),score=105.22 GCRY01000725.1:604-1854(-)